MEKSIPQEGSLHQDQPILVSGQPRFSAKAGIIMLHGRGSSAQDILTLRSELEKDENTLTPVQLSDFAYLAPQAAGGSWYPGRFSDSLVNNEPWLSSALDVVGFAIDHLTRSGIPAEKIILLGFSQGACLALEFAARHGRRYGGVAALSGALIGSEYESRQDQGDLAGTPVFMGCGKDDPHIPQPFLERSANHLTGMGADVTLRIYPNLGHTINQDEVNFVRSLMGSLLGVGLR